RSQYYITRALFGTRSLFAMTEPQFSSAKDDDTPFKVNGDPSPLTDQRIPTQPCEWADRHRQTHREHIHMICIHTHGYNCMHSHNKYTKHTHTHTSMCAQTDTYIQEHTKAHTKALTSSMCVSCWATVKGSLQMLRMSRCTD